MIARSLNKTVVFRKAFLLNGIDRVLPAGDYRIVTDEELIEGISFPVYRRVSTMIFVPAQGSASSIEMVTIDPLLRPPRMGLFSRHASALILSGLLRGPGKMVTAPASLFRRGNNRRPRREGPPA